MFLIYLSTLIGAILQKISGLGFALVVAPFFMLAVGVERGIVLVQICGALSAAIVLLRSYRGVNWRLFAQLVPVSLLGVALGTYLGSVIPKNLNLIVSSLVMLAALAVSVKLGKAQAVRRSPPLVQGTGLLAGLMTSLAGVGGTALVAFGRLTQWDQEEFAATLQPYFVTLSTFTASYLVFANPAAWPPLAIQQWVAILACLIGGVWLGGKGSRLLTKPRAAALTNWVAFGGAVFALISGLTAL